MDKRNTACYEALKAEDGRNRYCFFCGVTGGRFSTEQTYLEQTPQQELLAAWQREGRAHFNQCRKCGRWVFDAAYNPEVLECIECAPFELEARFCKFCGARVPVGSRTCPACGKMLYYEGVSDNDAENEASGA